MKQKLKMYKKIDKNIHIFSSINVCGLYFCSIIVDCSGRTHNLARHNKHAYCTFEWGKKLLKDWSRNQYRAVIIFDDLLISIVYNNYFMAILTGRLEKYEYQWVKNV